ncbi:hypothetical protein SALCHL_002569 [Streptomyces albus subsp. chlorinus]|uniref:hypothetical protein n=1 Tax=Streptomyces albus TaxID=1888 RepID=UPI00156D73E6|nr:hypothetical protein [Streptomyces albus]
MNDSPGWASPGSSSPDPAPDTADQDQGTPGDDTEHTTSEATPATPATPHPAKTDTPGGADTSTDESAGQTADSRPAGQTGGPADERAATSSKKNDAPTGKSGTSSKKGADGRTDEPTDGHGPTRTHTDERPPNWAPEQPPAAPQGWAWGSPQSSRGPGRVPGQQRGRGPGRPTGRSRGTTPSSGTGSAPAQGWNTAGWNSGWTQPPQAPKPGVVPLRPLGVGEILDGSVSTIRAHWRTVLGISLAVAVITELVSALVTGFWLGDTNELDALAKKDNPGLGELKNALTDALSSLTVIGIVGMLGSVIATGMLTVVVSRAVLGRHVTLGDAWRDSRPQLPRLLGLLVLIPLLVSAAVFVCMLPGVLTSLAGAGNLALPLLFLGLLAGIAAGAWIWVRFCLAPPALMLEKRGAIHALRRSVKLVNGNWWRVLGIQLLALVLIAAVSFVVSMPTAVVSALLSGGATLTDSATSTGWTALLINGIGSVVASALSLPLTAGITALLYLDQRIRREALDLELARAAGVPGYDRPEPERPTTDR